MSPWTDFHFLRPWWWLALLPVAWLLLRLWRDRGGAGDWPRVCDPELLRRLLVPGQGPGRRPLVWLGGGALVAVAALAGPAWSRLPQPVYRAAAARVIVLDLSQSMDAGDLAPSRLARARFKVLDALRRVREGQTALVVFAGDAFVVSPLTDDTATIEAMVPSLDTDLMPVQGSRPDTGLRLAEQLLERSGVRGGRVLLIGDGVSDMAAALKSARALRAKGRRLSVIGVGTRQGAPVPLRGGGFLHDARGAIVVPRFDPGPLRRLARAGGGRYAPISVDDRDLDSISAGAVARRDARDARATRRTADLWREEGPWLLLPLLPLAALGFRRGWLPVVLLAVCAFPPPSQAFGWQDLWSRPDQRAANAFAAGHPKEAARTFRDPAWQGTAWYRAGDYARAAQAFARTPGPRAAYNRGNTLVHLGRLRDALHAYEAALRQDPHDADARHNRDLVRRLLKQRSRRHAGAPGRGGKSAPSGQRQGANAEAGKAGHSAHGDKRSAAGPRGRGPSQAGRGAGAPRTAPPAKAKRGQRSGQTPRRASRASRQAHAGKGAGTGSAPRQRARAGSAVKPPAARRPGQGSRGRNVKPGEKAAAPAAAASGARHVAGQQAALSERELQQWLHRIPDDPGGLLRRKFRYEYRHRLAEGQDTGREAQPW